jgi:hypothetical protein
MPAWLHPLVHYADDFDQFRLDYTVVNDVHRPPDACPAIGLSHVSNVKASQARRQLGAHSRYPTLRFGRDMADRADQQLGISASGCNAPVLGAGGQNARDVSLGAAR